MTRVIWCVARTFQARTWSTSQALIPQANGWSLPRPEAGAETPAPPQPPNALPGLLSFFILRFDPTGNFALAKNLTGPSEDPAVYRFSSSTGVFTRVSSLPEAGVTGVDAPFGFTAFMGFTSDGRHALGVQKPSAGGPGAEVFVFDWDPNAGILSVHSHGILSLPDVVDFFPGFMAMADNLIFVQGGISENVVLRFDPATATITDTGQRFDNDAIENARIFADSRTHTVVGTSPGGNMVGIWRYDPVSGATNAAPGSPFPAAQNAYILEVLSH